MLCVQHHHAHIASVMAEYGLCDKVLGVVYDGTGFGTDGDIWGAEFMLADYRSFERIGHLKYVPLPGGDLAIKEPFRSALAYVHHEPELFRDFIRRLDKNTTNMILTQIKKSINSPLTSSMGRLFDAELPL